MDSHHNNFRVMINSIRNSQDQVRKSEVKHRMRRLRRSMGSLSTGTNNVRREGEVSEVIVNVIT